MANKECADFTGETCVRLTANTQSCFSLGFSSRDTLLEYILAYHHIALPTDFFSSRPLSESLELHCRSNPTTDCNPTPLPVAPDMKSCVDVSEDNAATLSLFHTPHVAIMRFNRALSFSKTATYGPSGHSVLTRTHSFFLPILSPTSPKGCRSGSTPWCYLQPLCKAIDTKSNTAIVTEADQRVLYTTKIHLDKRIRNSTS